MAILQLFLLISAILVVSTEANVCYAPPLVYGWECRSAGLFGRPNLKVFYTVKQVNNGRTLVCCKAKGCGLATSTSCSKWGFYSIGCSSSSGSIHRAVLWDNNAGIPAIKCYGLLTGTALIWSIY